MKIAIIGVGKIGSTIAKGLEKKGHSIIIGARDTASGQVIQLVKHGQHISANTIAEAVKQAEIIIIAVPLAAIPLVAESLGNTSSKMILETSNAFGHPLPIYGDGVNAIKKITGNPDVVKCFSTIGFEDLANPNFGTAKADAFVAGDSIVAKKTAQKLALDMDFETCYDLGGDEALPLLESLASIWWALSFKSGLGRRTAFKILHD